MFVAPAGAGPPRAIDGNEVGGLGAGPTDLRDVEIADPAAREGREEVVRRVPAQRDGDDPVRLPVRRDEQLDEELRFGAGRAWTGGDVGGSVHRVFRSEEGRPRTEAG